MFESFESGAIGLADGVSNAFADMAMGAKVSLQDFENMFKDFVKQMLAQAIKLLIVNAILRALGVPLRYDGSGFKAGAGDAFGGAVPQASAGGGAMSRGRPYLVGERGPELIIPASSGTIKNAHDTRNAMKGGATVVNQTINVETGVSQTVRAEMLSLLPVIKQDTLAAVADGKRRGGSFGQVLS
jgi:phage-related minor tail protein